MGKLYTKETYVNKTEGNQVWETEICETIHEEVGSLFASCKKDFGRAVSKMYVGEGEQIGWVFEKKVPYEDSKETYIQEVWVGVFERIYSGDSMYGRYDFAKKKKKTGNKPFAIDHLTEK